MRFGSLFLTSILAAACGTPHAQAESKNSNQVEIRVYDLSGIAVPQVSQAFRGALPASTAWVESQHQGSSGRPAAGTLPGGAGGGGLGGGGFGGGGGGFGGGGAGQGYFSIPSQFGNGNGGGGGFSRPVTGFAAASHSLQQRYEPLVATIAAHVEPTSWREQGGEAEYTLMNSVLVVSQSPANHERIATLLKGLEQLRPAGQTVRLHVWWLPNPEDQSQKLQTALRSENAIAEVTKLCGSLDGYQATLAVPMLGTSHVASGTRMPIVTSQIPVVGGEAGAAYQPAVTQVNLGLFAEASPRPVQLANGTAGIEVRISTAMTKLGDANNAADHNFGAIDRFVLGADVLETTCLCASGQARVIGTMTSTHQAQRLTVVLAAELN